MPSRRSFLAGAAMAATLAACGKSDDKGQQEASPDPASTPGTTAPATSVSTPPPVAAGGPARFVQRSDPASGRAALTFHFGGGSEATVDELLRLLESRGLTCTLFCVGSWLEKNPRFTQRAVDAGHEMANHTYSHGEMAQMDAAEVTAEIDRAADVLAGATGARGRWFRPSAMDVATPLVLEQAGTAGYPTVVGYDIDSQDYRDVPTAEVVGNCSKATAGSILSLHFGHQNTVEALPTVVDDFRRRGIEPVTVGTLLA